MYLIAKRQWKCNRNIRSCSVNIKTIIKIKNNENNINRYSIMRQRIDVKSTDGFWLLFITRLIYERVSPINSF